MFDPDVMEEIERRDRAAGVWYFSFDPRLVYRWLKKLFSSLFLVLIFVNVAQAWTEIGLNFRATSGYVTDEANQTYVLGDTYPTTRGGVTFGFDSALVDGTRDRSTSVDVRLAGINQSPTDSVRNFRVDLSATGDYVICIAAGDAVFSQSNLYLEVLDDSTSKFTLGCSGSNCLVGGNFFDASDTERTAAAWPAGQTCVAATFATTTFKLKLGTGSGSTLGTVAHLQIYSGSTPTTTTTTTTTLPQYTEICGDGRDNDGVDGDLPCPAPDADRDGYVTEGAGPNDGFDCDDTSRWIYPGITTSEGCSGGQVHTCQTDGTYSSCISLSSFTCHSGSGSTYWVDDAETDCSGTGSYADPENWLCWSNTGMTGYHAPVAGDCIVFRQGEYTGSWSSGTKQFYLYQENGTLANPITARAAPGETWWEVGKGLGVEIFGAGTFSPKNYVFPIQIYESSHVNTHGFEVTNLATGFGDAGIHYAGTTGSLGGRINNNYVWGINGEEDENNSGIKCRAELNQLEIDHNEVADVYERFATTADSDWNSQNNSGIRGMDCDEINIHDNVIYNSSTQAAYGISLKHGILGGVGATIARNIIQNTEWEGIQVDGIPNTVVKNNEIVKTNHFGIAQYDLGSTTREYDNLQVYNNTILNAACFESFTTNADAAYGTPVFTFNNNVCLDNRNSAYPADATDGFNRVNHYGSDALFTAMSGKAIFEDNCYFNAASTTLFFSYYGDNSSTSNGTTYSGLTAWKTAGFDTGTFNKNPTVNSYHIATDTDCDAMGWNIGLYSNDPAPPSTGGTSSGGSKILFLRR